MKRLQIFLIYGYIALFFVCCGNSDTQGNKRISNDHSIENLGKDTIMKPVINFYIENSGSMDGYVNGVTEFEQSIYSYLSDIKISGITDSLNLFYINAISIPVNSNADLDVISDFIEKLEPTTFQKKGGNRGNTDISDVIKTVLTKTQQNSISILVSDFIFSPGNGQKNPEEYMLNQQIGIKNTMATKFEIKNPAFVVYKLYSKFDGQFYYFDKNAKREFGKHYKGMRPFYIWIIGDVKDVSELCKQVPETKFKMQNEIKVFSVMAGNKEVSYAVKPYSGNFELSKKNTKTEILNLVRDNNSGKVKFAVNVNLSDLLLDDEYLTNPDNYELSNKNYKISIKKSPSNDKGYTHTLSFTSDYVHKGILSIKLKKQEPLPQWIEEANDTDGSQPELGKTYGIKFLIAGIFEGFTLKDKYYTEIKININ